MGRANAGDAIQARARLDSQAVAAEASVSVTVSVTPLPARVVAGPKLFDNVTGWGQWRGHVFACSSWNGHGDSGAWMRGAAVVWQ